MGGVKENDMAERLTKKINKTIQNKYSLGSYLYYDFAEIDDTNKLLNKLGKLEDILEKYGIESVEELECFLDDYSKNQGRYFAICEEMDDLKKDRDTWQKACELACREAPLHCPNPPEYYNAQDEYGSDEPYYIQESACEFSDDAERCLECQINYFYQQAKKEGDSI